MKQLGVGIIGAGIMGTTHAKACQEHPNLRVVGVADVLKEKAEKLAKEVGAQVYTDYEKMLKNEEIEVVFVTTPDHLHKEPAIAAADAEKHLWIEKPLATRIEDAREMLSALGKAQRKGVKITVQFSTRWYPFYEAARLVVAEGYLGDPSSSSMTISDRIDVPMSMWGGPSKTWAKYSTVADFLTCYSVDLIRTISGKEAKTVYAKSSSKVLKFTPDFYQAIVTFEDEFHVFFESSWILARTKPILSEHHLNFVCSEGTMQYTHANTTFATHAVGGGEIFFTEESSIDQLREIQEKLRKEGIISRIIWESERERLYGERVKLRECNRALWVPADAPHKVMHHQGGQLNNFVHSILEDEEPYVTLMDGYRSAEVVCAIKRSAETGEMVEL